MKPAALKKIFGNVEELLGIAQVSEQIISLSILDHGKDAIRKEKQDHDGSHEITK